MKHKDIIYIQNGFWRAYKDFRANRDIAAYNRKILALIVYYAGEHDKAAVDFCGWLREAWQRDVIGDNIGKISHEEVALVQSSLWKLYEQIRRGKSRAWSKEYTDRAADYYMERSDAVLNFFVDLRAAWSGVLEGLYP